jgi:hypothetical protein
MEKTNLVTHNEAWAIFWADFKGSDKWSQLSKKDKHTLTLAARDARRDMLGFARARRLIERYAPTTFQWVEGAIKIHSQHE